MSAIAEAGARRARPTPELLFDSLALARDGWRELGGAVLLGVLPAYFLVLLSAYAAGFSDPDLLALMLAGDEPGRVVFVAGVSVFARVVGLFTTLALIVAADARDRGAPVTALGAWKRAFELAVPFLSALARVAASTLLGALLFVVPGLIALLRGAFFAHAAAIEGLDGPQAAARSRELVTRRPGYLLGNLALSALVAGAAAFMAVLFIHVALAAPTAIVPAQGGALELELVALVDRSAAGVIGAWAAVFSVLLYKDAAAQ